MADWAKIASFYAGRPINVTAPDQQPAGGGAWGPKWGTSINSQGAVYLNPTTLQSLNDMVGKLQSKQANLYALSTLIHEAIHNRQDSLPGAKPWSDEWQAPAMASTLLPDVLQRFFGIKFNSPLGQYYWKQAKGIHDVGPPPKVYQDVGNDHNWSNLHL